ncbi:MAG: SEC59/DGK1/VTE5 family protein [Chloroherpetonaceae bacterium]|nr:SEC59/DGK1/VTE5 family protein [Chloroherpetonaceae bacterium]
MKEYQRDVVISAKTKSQTAKATSDAAGEQIDYKNELARKAIHLASILIPIIYYHITKELALMLLVPMFLGFFLVDFLKMFVKPVANLYYKHFGAMLRPHELDPSQRNFNGATYVTLAAVLVVWLFPKIIAIASFAILILADTAAALVGRKFGKTKIGAKTLEGSVAFFALALLVVFVTPKLNPVVGLVIAVSATLAELYPIRLGNWTMDDNLAIPLVSAMAGLLCYLTFIPHELAFLN